MARRIVDIRCVLLGDAHYLNSDDLLSLLEERLTVAMTMESRLMLTHLILQLKEAHEEEIKICSPGREVR